ncbi:MAG: hypothetical protein R3E39_14720 [Anaerolineae bacterium]
MANLNILYTANLRGAIEMLPRLHTFIRQLKSLPLDEENDVMLCMVEPVQTRWLLLDLGDSCDSAIWHCAATAGRSMLIALDAMGFHAANVEGMLSAASRERLRDNLLGMALVDAETTWRDGDDVMVMYRGGFQTRPYLQIELMMSAATHVDDQRLYLAEIQVGQVGQAVVSLAGGQPELLSATVHDLPASALPDPTIAGTVDFILSEARLFQGRHSTD